MTTKQRFFSSILLLVLIFLLLYVWVRVSLSSAARNLGVIFDSELALKESVNKLCQLAYQEIRWIGSIRQYLSAEVTRTLVYSLVLSRLDYCSALLAGCPQVLLD